DRAAGHAVGDGGLRHGGADAHDQARIEWLGNEVLGPERHAVGAVGGGHDVALLFFGDLTDRMHGGLFHAAGDGGCADVERSTEDVREAQNVVDLVGVVGTPRGHDHVVAHGVRVFRKNLRVGVGQRQNQRARCHALDHLGLEHATRRQAQEHIGIVDDIAERARIGFLGKAFLDRVHENGAALVDHAFNIGHPDVLERQAHVDHEVEAGQRRGARAGHHDLDLVDIFAYHRQAIDERRGDTDCRAVLIVVEYRNVHALAQFTFDVETFGRLDVFKVDTAKGGLQAGDDVDQAVGIEFVDLDIEHVDIGKLLEQHRLALHDGLGSQRADVAQPQYGGTVGDDPDQIATAGVLEGVLRITDDFFAGRRHSGGVSQRQIALVCQLLGGRDGYLARAALPVIFEGGLAKVGLHDFVRTKKIETRSFILAAKISFV